MELFEEIEERYIETNGIKLHVAIVGSGEPIVLLHGFPDFWYGWKNVIIGLKDEFKLIIPDTRGINLSEKPEGIENYDLKILIDDIKGLIEELKLGAVNLCGHDWGGPIAWGVAEKYPELLKKLIIINAPHHKVFQKTLESSKKQRKASGYMTGFQKPGAENLLLANDCQALRVAVFNGGKNKDVLSEFDKEKYLEAWKQPGAIKAGLNYYRAMRLDEESTGIISVPTLVIWGMRDPYLRPILLEGLEDYVKDLKVTRVEEATHWVMHDEPDVVSSSIREFVKS